MIKHLLKLIWNRKRASALIVVEIVLSFLVLTAVLSGVALFAGNWQRPLGYEWENVWNITLGLPQGAFRDGQEEASATFAVVMRELNGISGIESSAGVAETPFREGSSTWIFDLGDGRQMRLTMNYVTDDFAETMGIEVTDGRWFGEADDGLDYIPVLLNQNAVDTYYDRNPIGEYIRDDPPQKIPFKVVGLFTDYRKNGELSSPTPYAFVRTEVGTEELGVSQNVVLKVAGGTGPEFEVEILERLRGVAPTWTFDIRPLSQMRRSSLKLQFVPIIAGGTVALFMIILVGLGLTGVMWQNVTRRTQEIGLRRALGASEQAVHLQILTEILLVTSVALALGLVIALQVPVMDLIPDLRPDILAAGVTGAVLMITLIVTVCGFYPSRLASRVTPAEALHYE